MQPRREEILVGDFNAVMPQDVFLLLHEYSHSFPTGVHVGKMWKTRYRDIDNAITKWYLRWYAPNESNPERISIFTREITVMDWKALTGASS